MIGERLRQARLAAGLTLDQVSAQLGALGQPITKAGLSKYERNGSTPPPTLLLKLAHVLGVTSHYFLQESEVRIEWLAFRKHPQLPVSRQEHIKAYAAKVAEGQVWLQHTLYPNEQPVMLMPRSVETSEEAEQAAMDLRALWGLGEAPIESVTQAAELHGAVVVDWKLDEGTLDGISGWVNNIVPLAVVNTSTAPDRRRYTLSHELGHMVMHTDAQDPDEEERLAHRFAAAFLVPEAMAHRELGERRRHLSLDELALLKRKYGLSMNGWVHRAYDLGIIDEGHHNTLCRAFVEHGWKKKEPVAYDGWEEPKRLEQLVLHALAEGVITEARATQLCPWRDRDDDRPAERPAESGLTATALLRLPAGERSRALAAAAAAAAPLYRGDPDLTGFDAFGEDDLYADPE